MTSRVGSMVATSTGALARVYIRHLKTWRYNFIATGLWIFHIPSISSWASSLQCFVSLIGEHCVTLTFADWNRWLFSLNRKLKLNLIGIFTALHGMQTRSSDEISVRLHVCQTRALWQNGRKICPDFYTIRKIIQSSFLRRRMVGERWPLLSEILGQPAPVGAKSPILNR